MAKNKSDGTMATLGGVFCLFVVFLKCISLISAFSLSGLMVLSLWLVFGLCLLPKRKNWIPVIGMLPLLILTVQGAWYAVPMDDVMTFLKAVVCRVMPAAGFVVLFVLLFLCCINGALGLRKGIWALPIFLTLPWCVWQSASTLPWAQFGAVACVSIWIKPSGK